MGARFSGRLQSDERLENTIGSHIDESQKYSGEAAVKLVAGGIIISPVLTKPLLCN